VDEAFWGWNDIWLHPAFRQWNIEEYLPAIEAPVLVLQGEQDQYGTSAQLQAIADQVGGTCRITLLPQCAHTPHREQPAATLQAVAGFIDELGASDRRAGGE